MDDGEARVRVTLRGRLIAAEVRLWAAATGDDPYPFFVALAEPLPVGTILGIAPVDGAAPAWAFEVRRVQEALWVGPGGLRGCHGRRVAVDLGAWGRRVGSEHLPGGIAARRLRLCPAVAAAAPRSAPQAAVIQLRRVVDPSPRAAGGGKPRRGRARP